MKQALAATTPRVGMGRRGRTGVVAVAVSALTAAVFATAAPASAAPPSLTATSCVVDGGAYTAAKGVRTCTVTGPLVSSTVDNLYAEVEVAGGIVFGRWSEVRQTQAATVQTLQKGKLTTTSSTTLVTRTVSPASCSFLSYATFSSSNVPFGECYDAGVYPANIA